MDKYLFFMEKVLNLKEDIESKPFTIERIVVFQFE